MIDVGASLYAGIKKLATPYQKGHKIGSANPKTDNYDKTWTTMGGRRHRYLYLLIAPHSSRDSR